MLKTSFFVLVTISWLMFFWIPGLHAAGSVDINTATPDQLKTLPGMTEGYAMMIVGGRPFQSKEDLLERKILPQEAYEQMKDHIVAKGSSMGGSPRSTPTTSMDRPAPAPAAESAPASTAVSETPRSAESSTRVCIKDERTKERVCGELIK